eukprot:526747-Prorocentrum_minimum.AAC.1
MTLDSSFLIRSPRHYKKNTHLPQTDTPFQRDPELGPDFAGCNVPNGVKGALYCIDAACACLDSSKSKDNPKQILGGIRSW